MFLVSNHLLLGRVVLSLDLVDNDPILVDQGAEDQISCLLFDEDIAIRANLLKTSRSSDPEHSLPCISPCESIVELIRELKTIFVFFKIWVEVQ